MIRIVVPLVSKVLIDEITRARAFRLALAAGESTADLSPPKSIGYSIGISVALFVMLVVSSVFTYHAQVRWGELGLSVRGAVGHLHCRSPCRLTDSADHRPYLQKVNVSPRSLDSGISVADTDLSGASPVNLACDFLPEESIPWSLRMHHTV